MESRGISLSWLGDITESRHCDSSAQASLKTGLLLGFDCEASCEEGCQMAVLYLTNKEHAVSGPISDGKTQRKSLRISRLDLNK